MVESIFWLTPGFVREGRFVEMTEDDWDSMIAVHLKGHFSCSKAAAREMIKQKSGRIINISSNAAFNFKIGKIGRGGISYSTAKAGVLGFTARLSAELKEYGITVNAILPAAITQGFPHPRPRIVGGGEIPGPGSWRQ